MLGGLDTIFCLRTIQGHRISIPGRIGGEGYECDVAEFTLFNDANVIRLPLYNTLQLLDIPAYFCHFVFVELGGRFYVL